MGAVSGTFYNWPIYLLHPVSYGLIIFLVILFQTYDFEVMAYLIWGFVVDIEE